MEGNKQKAILAKDLAEIKMRSNDFQGAQNTLLVAKNLFPQLENISQLLAVCDVHCSALNKIQGTEKDWYKILQLEGVVDEVTIKKQYRKLALVLHPDKNKFPGAESAFKLIGEANMMLSDKERKFNYDMKYPKSVPCKVNQNLVKKSSKVQNMNPNVPTFWFNGLNRYQPTKPDFFADVVFPLVCRVCKFQYQNSVGIKCPNCFKACDFSSQGAMPGSNQGKFGAQGVTPCSNRSANAVSQQKQVPKQASKVGSTENSGRTGGTTEVGGGLKNKVQTCGQDSVDCQRRSSRKRKNVSYNEIVGDDDHFVSPQKRAQETNSWADKGEQKESSFSNEKSKAGNADNKDEESSVVDDHESNLNSDCTSLPEFVEYPDAEFSDFDTNREGNHLCVGQIWACYDTIDGMPRFYARIKKILSKDAGFKLCITWLEADPEKQDEIDWANAGLPVVCGKFVHGDNMDTSDRLMLSHIIGFEKQSNRGSNSYMIYPRKGETWALYNNWDVGWSSDPENHKKFKFLIVEILSDFCHSGIEVGFLEKNKGFVSLFQRTTRNGVSTILIPSRELLRFSHQILSFKMTGSERADVPEGSFELDPAALPTDPNDL